MRFLITLLFITLLCTCVRAQLQPDLQLLAKPFGDGVDLRWAPADYTTWRLLQVHGVLVERRQLGSSVGFQPLGERIRAYSLSDFRGLADTTDVHVVTVAEALYGEATASERTSEMGVALDLHETQQQRLFLALVNADLSAAAATCLGWSYRDKETVAGVPYEYRVRLLTPDTAHLSNAIRMRSTDRYDDTPPDQFALRPGEGKVTLTWSVADAERFSGYHLERSADGQMWERPLNAPLIQEPEEEEFAYELDMPENGRKYYFRLRGIDPFGWVSPPTEAVLATTVDRAGPATPTLLRGEALPDGSHRIWWMPAQPASPDLAGFRVLRGPTIDGPFLTVMDDLLPTSATEWIDTKPLVARSSFYTVEAVDEAGNGVRSPVNFVRPRDDTPPAKPVGLTGRIDTFGRVVLLWEPGTEPDLLGYRVYSSHALDREFLQVTNEVQHRNFFFDSTTLLVLNETILYKIVAVDRHYNPSPYSAILELRRPDKIAPAPPAISGYSARGTAVELHLRPSESRDVVRQTVWRSEAGETARPLAAIGAKDTLYLDRTTKPRNRYVYTVRAEDEVGLFGESDRLAVRSGAVTARNTKINLARTQVQGEVKEMLRWSSSDNDITSYQLFAGATPDALRPLRKLSAGVGEWPVVNPSFFYAIRALYPDGGRSPLSNVVEPTKR